MRLLVILGVIFCLGVADLPAAHPISVIPAHELPADDNEEIAVTRNQATKQKKKSYLQNVKANPFTGILLARFSSHDIVTGESQFTHDIFIVYRNIRI